MLRTFMISAAVSALMVTGSLAQNAPSPQEQVTAKSDTSSPHFLKEQGTDHFVFSGRVSTRRVTARPRAASTRALAAGHYRLRAVAMTAAGRSSAAVSRAFRVRG